MPIFNEPACVREASPCCHYRFSQSEEQLQRWWLQHASQTRDLVTTDFETVVILDPGLPNRGPGPDMLHAHLLLEDRELSGSVEFHRRASDWYLHGHHKDHRYDDVILHLVADPMGGPSVSTLICPQYPIQDGGCLARRPITHAEILVEAWRRFDAKQKRVQAWIASGIQPEAVLALGLYDVKLRGISRRADLREMANRLGLRLAMHTIQASAAHHPRPRQLIHSASGCEQTHRFYQRVRLLRRMLRTRSSAELLAMDNAFAPSDISQHAFQEWKINYLSPCLGATQGFSWWCTQKPFQKYGLERRMITRLGLEGVGSIAVQQAILSWNNTFCERQHCSSCPLLMIVL